MKKVKRNLVFLLVSALLFGLLAGCGGKFPPEAVPEGGRIDAPNALGQFVETEIPLPGKGNAQDMVLLEDGRLRVVLDQKVCTTGPDRESWEQTTSLPAYPDTLALSPKGDVFFSSSQKRRGEEGYDTHFWHVSPDGRGRELPVACPEGDDGLGTPLRSCDFTDNGRLLASFYTGDIREIDLETGELSENRNDLGMTVGRISCAGEEGYLLDYGGDVGVLRSGGAETVSGVLGEQLSAAMKALPGIGIKTALWLNPDGYLFFTTQEGLFSYIPGGSITEELVRGARTALGDPAFSPIALTGGEDGSFYVLGNFDGGGSALFRYTYDPQAPTTPATTLRIYSLHEDEDLRQMIAQYQKAHPEVAVDLEVGLTGEDGFTQGDAIRTLNTEILAGDGPDILALDGFDLDPFLEKDLLTDLNGVLDQAGPLLHQVTDCYAREGKVCALPTAFAIPAIYGPGHIVSQIRDLDSLVSAAAQAKAENQELESVLYGVHPGFLADKFYDSCSAAWVLPDGSLDQEKLTEFYTAMAALYALDADFRQALADQGELPQNTPAYAAAPPRSMGNSLRVCLGQLCLSPGTLSGTGAWAEFLAGDDQLEGYETAQLNLQAPNTFLPRRILGILSTSPHQEQSAQFLAYMLSPEAQSELLTSGFPVNQTVFDREIAEDRTVDVDVILTEKSTGESAEGRAQYPDQARRQDLKRWVDHLTTPAPTDQIIRAAVIGQAIPCLEGQITPEAAAQNVWKSLNLYLTE